MVIGLEHATGQLHLGLSARVLWIPWRSGKEKTMISICSMMDNAHKRRRNEDLRCEHVASDGSGALACENPATEERAYGGGDDLHLRGVRVPVRCRWRWIGGAIMRTPNARFWQWINGGPVKITLRPGQTITHYVGGSTDEGYERTWHKWH